MVFVVFAAICLAPPLFVKAFLVACDRWSGLGESRAAAAEMRPDAEECRVTLSRLAAEHDKLMAGDVPIQGMRLRALATAYDDALRHACQAVKLDPPPVPMDAVTRVQVEAELVVHGMSW